MAEQLFAQLQRQFDCFLRQDAMTAIRQKSWQQFTALGLPLKSEEAFRYVSLRDLYATSFEVAGALKIEKTVLEPFLLPESKHSHLVFVDGVFSKSLSDLSALDSQTLVLSLSEAMQTHASFLQNHFSKIFKEEKDPFFFLNLALHQEGVFFYLPPKLKGAAPVQCLHVLTGTQPSISFPRIYLALGAESELSWIESHYQLHSDVSHFSLPSIEISLEDGAHLNFLQSLSTIPFAWHMESLRAQLKKNARLDALSITTGAKALRQSYRVQLKGEGAETNLNGLWMLAKNRTAHTHAIVEHIAPFTRSMQRFKGVLNETSQSSFEGKILVRDTAQKTEAYQINNNLILSPTALANSKPNLEIFADDVKASHGATVSQLDEEQLFYLKTRGLDEALAKYLLIRGFCCEMIEQIPYPSMLQKLQRHIDAVVNV